jgi:hypothetical protein
MVLSVVDVMASTGTLWAVGSDCPHLYDLAGDRVALRVERLRHRRRYQVVAVQVGFESKLKAVRHI